VAAPSASEFAFYLSAAVSTQILSRVKRLSRIAENLALVICLNSYRLEMVSKTGLH
jgi:hypothetical protein